MTLEITHGKSLYAYRIDPANPRVVQHRANRPGERWVTYMTCHTVKEARAAVLALREEDLKMEGQI